MPNHRPSPLSFIAVAIGAALALGLSAAPPALAQAAVPESPAQIQMSFAPVVRTAAPAVVNVYSSRTVRQQSMFQSLFGPQFGPPQERTEQSLGSGVIVASDGVIVTNNHVVEGAQELKVVLNDRREYDAELLMADARTDLAVLRIAATGLPTLDYARSSQLEVGDLVLAIGNPFGVGQSVSSGIVSALARTDVGITDYSFFIQTDAAVNPGNSGGALVDLNGDLVGVNTAIFSRSGDSSGIGFAIPSELVQRVVETALEGGVSMVRPWLGAGLQTVTPDLAASLGLDRPQGALINEIYEGGPADMAGLQIGDVITAVDGSAVNDLNAVRFLLATHRVGDTASAIVLRDAQERTVRIPVETPPDSPAPEEVRITGANPFQGAVIANLSPAFADEVGLDPLDSGVIVIDVAGRSNAGVWLRPGDKILSIGERPVRSVSDATDLLRQYDGAPVWPLAIERDGQRFEPTLRL